MKVWIVQHVDYEYTEPEGVYSSEVRATAAVARLGDDGCYQITEYEVDPK